MWPVPSCHSNTSPACRLDSDWRDPLDKRPPCSQPGAEPMLCPLLTDKMGIHSSPTCQCSARAWLYLRKLFFLQSHGQWTMPCLLKMRLRNQNWPDTSLQFPYAPLNILPKLISLFQKPSIHVGQAASACAVQSAHFSLYITQRNELLLWNH